MSNKIQDDKLQVSMNKIEELVAAYRELWEAVENGTVDKNFFELRERFRRNTGPKKTSI